MSTSERDTKRKRRKESGSGSHKQDSEHFVVQAMLTVGRVAMLAILFAVPWHYGSVTWQDQRLLAMIILPLAGLALFVGILKKRLVIPRFAWVPAVFVLLAVVQTLPLPEFAYQFLSPRAKFETQVAEVSAEFGSLAADTQSQVADPTAPKPARALSVYPAQTKASLCTFAFAILFMACGQVFLATRSAQTAMFAVLAVSIFAHASLGLYEKVSWSEWTLLPDVKAESFSTLVSRNSAPQLYGIGIGALLGLMVSLNKGKVSKDRHYQVRYPAGNLLAKLRRKLEEILSEHDTLSIALLILICMLFFITVATQSRGGILATILALAAMGARSLQRQEDRLRAMGFLLFLSVVLLGMMVFLGLDDLLTTSLSSAISEAQNADNGRFRLWSLVLSDSSFWLAGAGLGTFHFATLPLQASKSIWAYHGESIYVEAWTEFGILGAAMAALYVLFVFRMLFRASRDEKSEAIGLCLTFAFTVIAIQSFVDFSLIIPTIFLPLCALMGAYAAIQFQNSKRSDSVMRFGVDRVSCLVLLAVCGFALPVLSSFAEGEKLSRVASGGERDAIMLVSGATDAPEIALQTAIIEQNNFQIQLAQSLGIPDSFESARRELSRAEKISAVVRASQDSELKPILDRVEPAEMEKLASTVGQAKRAADACPMDWRATWAVLRGDARVLSNSERAENYARLLLTTSHHPKLQLRIGEIAIVAGETDVGIRFWRQAVNNHPEYAGRAAGLMKLGVPPEQLREVVRNDSEAMLRLARQLEEDEALVEALLDGLTLEDLEPEGRGTSNHWLNYAWLAKYREEPQESVEALERAAKLEPMDSKIRMRLARELEAIGDYEGAIQWVKQAKRRGGDNAEYRELLQQLERKQRESRQESKEESSQTPEIASSETESSGE